MQRWGMPSKSPNPNYYFNFPLKQILLYYIQYRYWIKSLFFGKGSTSMQNPGRTICPIRQKPIETNKHNALCTHYRIHLSNLIYLEKICYS